MELLRICVRIYLLSGIIRNERENPSDWQEWDINMDVTKGILGTIGLYCTEVFLLCIRKLSWKTGVSEWVGGLSARTTKTVTHVDIKEHKHFIFRSFPFMHISRFRFIFNFSHCFAFELYNILQACFFPTFTPSTTFCPPLKLSSTSLYP